MRFSPLQVFMRLFAFFLPFLFSCKSDLRPKKTEISLGKILPVEKEEWTVEKLRAERPYDYFDTLLSNGYHLSHDYFEDSEGIGRFLLLKRGSVVIDTLSVMGYSIQDKSLGYIGNDFKDYFAFVNSFGSGNPHEMKLIKKSNGAVIREGYIIKGNKKHELLLYVEKKGAIIIYDIKNQKDIVLPELDNKVMDWQLGELITFDRVTDLKIELGYKNLEENDRIEIIQLDR